MRWVLGLALLLLAASADAQTTNIPIQGTNAKNQQVTSGVASAVSITLTATQQTRVYLYSLSARCSAGSAGITITDGGVQTWSTDTGFVITTQSGVAWTPAPYTSNLPGNTLVVTLGSCGGGNSGTLNIQASIF